MKNNKEVCTLIVEHLVDRLVNLNKLDQEKVIKIVRNNLSYLLKVIDYKSNRIYHLRKRTRLKGVLIGILVVALMVISKKILGPLVIGIVLESYLNGSLRFLRDELTVKYIVPGLKIKRLCKIRNGKFKVIVIGQGRNGTITIMNIDDERIKKLNNPKIYISNKETLYTFILKYINESKCDLEDIIDSLESFVLACYYSI